MDGTLIYLAITRGRNRLVISGSFELYGEFMQASLPAIHPNLPGATVHNPVTTPPDPNTQRTRKG